MKVLLAHKFFHVTGGAEVFFRETGRLLESRGHEVVYFSTTPPPSEGLVVEANENAQFVDPPNYSEGSFLSRASQIGRVIYSRRIKSAFAKLLQEKKPDIIHVFAIHIHLTPSILVAAAEAGIPVVMSCNDYKHICPNYKLYHHGKICMDCEGGRFFNAVRNRCCKDSWVFSAASAAEAYVHNLLGIYRKYVDMYLFSSRFMARQTERFWGRNTFRWKLLTNPFDSTKYDYSPESRDYCLYFGRLVDEKGVDVLLRAAAYAPDINIKVVGSGPDEATLKALASSLGLKNVEFCGPLWGGEMDSLLKRARFIVVPSVWHENYPYVINQAFAFGKPVVGSDRGGIPELVAHGERGLVYDASDEMALTKVMRRLWDRPEYAAELGRNAKTFSDAAFNDARQYEILMDIYQGVVGESTGFRR